MSKLEPQYLFKDKEHHDPSALSDYDTLDFVSNDQHVYGEIMWPDGEYDSCAPLSEMVQPLWNKLETHNTQAVQRLKIYPAEHGLLGCRISAITEIADFLTEICY